MPNPGILGGWWGGASERPGGSAGRTAGRVGSGGPAGRLGRPKCRPAVRPADTAAEPNRRNLTGRAEPPPRVPPVHSVQPIVWYVPEECRVLKGSKRLLLGLVVDCWPAPFCLHPSLQRE